MKSLQIFLAISVCAFSINIYGQNNERLDSLLNVYNLQPDDTSKVQTLKLLFESYLNNDLEEAKEYALAELELSEQLNFDRGKGLANLHLGVFFYYQSQLDSAKSKYQLSKEIFYKIESYRNVAVVLRNLSGIEYALGNYDSALNILDEGVSLFQNHILDTLGLAPFHQQKGLIHQHLGNYQIATKEVIKALRIFDASDNKIGKADALNLLAQVEASQEMYKEAIENNLKAVDIYRKLKDKSFEGVALNDIGNYYIYLDDYEHAIEYLELALPLTQEMNMQSIETTVLTNLGKAYIGQNKLEKSISYLNDGLKIAEEIQAQNKIAESLNELGSVYSQKNDVSKAVFYLNRSIEISENTTAKATLADAYLKRSMAYSNSNNYKSAYEDHLVYKELSDSIYDKTKSQQIEELKTIYETEKKEQQIAQQETQIRLLEQKEEISSLQKLILGGGLGLSLLVLLVGFYGVRQKMEKDKIEREKVESELAFKQKELTTHALHLAKKNEVLEGLKQKAQQLKQAEESGKGYQQLIRIINFDLKDDNNWEVFSKSFQELHKDFDKNVNQKYPDITAKELRLMSLVKMNLSIKEIANILNITVPGVKKARQRLRKKMGLETKDSLEKAILEI